MRKRFFTKSIVLNGLLGLVLGICLFIPSIMVFDTRPWLGIAGGLLYAVLLATFGTMIDAKFKDKPAPPKKEYIMLKHLFSKTNALNGVFSVSLTMLRRQTRVLMACIPMTF